MLIRVDIFPSGSVQVDADGPPPVSPVAPLYVCLGTCNEKALLTVGRKDAHVCFSDKSVSRQHLELVLLCASNEIDGKATPPTTPDERKACKHNPLHMCIVAKDLDSKYGTYRVVENDSEEEEVVYKDDDGSHTGDDETDDEGGLPQPPAASATTPALSDVASRFVKNPRTATLDKIETSGRMLLPDIERSRIILQCGHHGSTLVLTHVPLILAWSTVDTSTRDLWNKRMLWMGASSLDTQHHALDDSLTHLVANERKPNAKQLCAWVLQRPIVTTQYLQMMWDRQTPSDAMRPMSDFRPTDPQKSKFWNETTPSPTLFKDCTLLSLVQDDMECLCRAAGSAVVQLHTLRTEKQFGAKLTQLKKRINDTHYFCIVMPSPPNKKVEKRLEKLQAAGIAVYTNQKLIAKSVAYQEGLRDVEGKFVAGGANEADATKIPSPTNNSNNNDSDPGPSEPLVSVSEGGVREEEELVPVAEPLEAIPEERLSELQDSSTEKDESTLEKNGAITIPAQTAATEPSGWISSKKRSRDEVKSMSVDESQEQHTEQEAEPRRQRRRLTHSYHNDDDDDAEMEASHQDHRQGDDRSSSKRPKLPTTSDGWLVAAPRGAERKAYRTSVMELREYTDGEDIPATAPTDCVSNLVVDITNRQARRDSTSRSSTTSGKKNFKKFRKNLVFKVAEEDRVVLNVVTPKVTEKQRALEEEHRRLEVEESKANDLFGDPDKASKKRGRLRF